MLIFIGASISTLSFLATALLIHLNVKSLGLFYYLTGYYIIIQRCISSVEFFFRGLSGLGMGFVFMVARTITTEWFDTKYTTYLSISIFIHHCKNCFRLGLASGIAQAGVGLGQFVIPPLAEMLMEKWGLVRTFLVLSGVTGSGLGISNCQFM